MNPSINSIVEEFEERFKQEPAMTMTDFNSRVHNAVDFLRSSLTSYTEGVVKEIELLNEKSERIYKENLSKNHDLSNSHAQAIAIRNEIITLIKKP